MCRILSQEMSKSKIYRRLKLCDTANAGTVSDLRIHFHTESDHFWLGSDRLEIGQVWIEDRQDSTTPGVTVPRLTIQFDHSLATFITKSPLLSL